MSEQILYLKEFLIIFFSAIVVITISARFKLPSMIGLILTGFLVGPSGFTWIENIEHIESISEWGVVFLLFVIGLEFSLKHVRQQGRLFLLGGLYQSSFTLGIMWLFCFYILGFSAKSSFFFSFLVVLSSTALVLTLLYNSRQMESPQGRISTWPKSSRKPA